MKYFLFFWAAVTATLRGVFPPTPEDAGVVQKDTPGIWRPAVLLIVSGLFFFFTSPLVGLIAAAVAIFVLVSLAWQNTGRPPRSVPGAWHQVRQRIVDTLFARLLAWQKNANAPSAYA